VVYFAWAILTGLAAHRIALYLLLMHLYGFSRVRSEHLYFVSIRKGYDWIVSNGDHVDDWGKALHFLIIAGVWPVLFLTTFFIIRHFLPERKDTNAA